MNYRFRLRKICRSNKYNLESRGCNNRSILPTEINRVPREFFFFLIKTLRLKQFFFVKSYFKLKYYYNAYYNRASHSYVIYDCFFIFFFVIRTIQNNTDTAYNLYNRKNVRRNRKRTEFESGPRSPLKRPAASRGLIDP